MFSDKKRKKICKFLVLTMFSSNASKLRHVLVSMVKLERERERERESERDLSLKREQYRIPGCQPRITIFGRMSTEQIQTSTAIFASNVKLTGSTVDRVVPHSLLVYPYLRIQQTYMYACSRDATKTTKSEESVQRSNLINQYLSVIVSEK